MLIQASARFDCLSAVKTFFQEDLGQKGWLLSYSMKTQVYLLIKLKQAVFGDFF